MAGLLSDVLPFIYSRSNALKRNVNSLLDAPFDYFKQGIGQGNDDARVQNGLLAAAVKENGYGPANQALQNQTSNFVVNSIGPLATKFVYPQEAALKLAQQRAALPVEQGGLGLHPNNTPMERAQAMGMEDIGAHYTPSDFSAFKIGTRPDNFAVWSTLDKSSNLAAHNIGRNGDIADGVQGMPLMARIENRMPLTEKRLLEVSSDFPRSVTELDASKASDAGYDHAKIGSEVAIFDPSRIRSRFAAFDPMRRGSPDILAGLLPLSMADEDNRNQLRGLLGY